MDDDKKVKVYYSYCFMLFDEPVHVEKDVDGLWKLFSWRNNTGSKLSGKSLSDTFPSWAWITDNPYDLVYLHATKRDTDVQGLGTYTNVQGLGTLKLPTGCNLYNVRPTVIVTKTRPGSDWVDSKRYVEANMPLPLPEGALTNTVDWLDPGPPCIVGTRTVYASYPKPSTNYHDNYYGTHLQVGYTYYQVVDATAQGAGELRSTVKVYKCIWKYLVGESKVALLIELNEQEVALELLQGYSGDSKDSKW